MQIVYDDGAASAECDLVLARPDATVADLARALRTATPDLVIDGRAAAGDTPLAGCGLLAGSTVRPGRSPAPVPAPDPVAVLRVVGGLCAGLSVPLAAGRAIVGRGRVEVGIEDTAVSRRHCRLDVAVSGRVTVADLGSRNGTDVNGRRLAGPRELGPDDLVCLGGAVLIRVLPVAAVDRPVPLDPVRDAGPGGTVPWTRSPRPPLGPPEGTHPLPVKPTGRGGVTGRRHLRQGLRQYLDEVAALHEALRQRRAGELVRRRARLPDPAELLHRAAAPTARLWERRADTGDLLRLMLGTADQPWAPPVHSDRAPPDPEVAEVLEDLALLPAVPVPVGVSAGNAIALYGDRRAALAVARSLLCQAAVTSGPADVAVAICTNAERAADWDWAKWLPHTVDRRGGGGRLLAGGAGEVAALAQALAGSRGGAAADRPVLLVVVDGAALLEGWPCPLRDVLAGRYGPAAGIVLTDRPPALCTATVQVAADSSATLHRLTAGEMVTGVLAAGLPEAAARGCARALARFEDPDLLVAARPAEAGEGTATEPVAVRPFRFPAAALSGV
jgi:DNA segregation ATPase FtsK/SpoIIIE, S-DNA-T family